MNGEKRLEVELGAAEDAATTFARDQLMMLRCADDAVARARVWRRPEEGLVLGRFHRASVASHSGGNSVGLSRRLSGGRIVPVGPGVVCVTTVAPLVNWLDPTATALRPEQVLNRAVRPLLALLRGDGIDAFYPGRDLVTENGRAVAHLSFTVMRDGLAVVEMQVAETAAFSNLPQLLDRFDSGGVAGVDRSALAASASLADLATPARDDAAWASRFAECAATAFACESVVVGDSPSEADPSQRTTASQQAANDFLASPGPAKDGLMSAASVSMLGMVECTGRMRGDRLTGLCITGDLIAPFHTLDDLAAQCEGEPFRPANIRKALARAMAAPRSFLLGLPDLDELILRLA